jgi:hypothetical protein
VGVPEEEPGHGVKDQTEDAAGVVRVEGAGHGLEGEVNVETELAVGQGLLAVKVKMNESQLHAQL